MVNLFGDQVDSSGADLLGLLIGATDLPFFWGPIQVDEGEDVGNIKSVRSDPAEDRPVVGEDGVWLLFFDPGDDGGFGQLIHEEWGNGSFMGMGSLPSKEAPQPAASHLVVDEARHDQADPAVATFLALVEGEGNRLHLTIGHAVHRFFGKGVAEGNGGKGIEGKREFHSIFRQWGDEEAANSAILQDPGKFVRGLVTDPDRFHAVAQGAGAASSPGEVSCEGGIFLPPQSGRKRGDKSQITDELHFAGGAEGGHQGADHGVGGVADLLSDRRHPRTHGRRDTRTPA